MTRVLITGATGFVGSHILEAAMADPALTPIAACRAPERLLPGFSGEIRRGDLRDPAYLERLVADADVICHAAAWTSAYGHAHQSDALFLAPSLALLRMAARHGLRRFVFLSSTSVAAPRGAHDPMSIADPGKLGHWPHLRNVARIEADMRALAASTDTEMTSLRVGLFAGRRYALGLLPLLVPRLKTHLVPWVAGGRTSLPIVEGRDIGRAFALAAKAASLPGYQGFNIVGPEVPSARQVITHLAQTYGLPRPHFSVPFPLAYGFARAMELLDPLVPWEPLVTRAVIQLLEETSPDNDRATRMLGYVPQHGWRDAIALQMAEMDARAEKPMSMVHPLN